MKQPAHSVYYISVTCIYRLAEGEREKAVNDRGAGRVNGSYLTWSWLQLRWSYSQGNTEFQQFCKEYLRLLRRNEENEAIWSQIKRNAEFYKEYLRLLGRIEENQTKWSQIKRNAEFYKRYLRLLGRNEENKAKWSQIKRNAEFYKWSRLSWFMRNI